MKVTTKLLNEVGGTFGDLLTDPARDGRGIDRWGEARDVDVSALYSFARVEALDAIKWLGSLSAKARQRAIRKAISAVAVRAFIMGMEVERRWHDAAALPALGELKERDDGST